MIGHAVADTEVLDARQGLSGEGLVELDETHVVQGQTGLRSSALRLAGAGPMPMISGGTPATPMPLMVTIGLRPRLLASLADMTTVQAAPSLRPEALPAVTVPPSLKTAGSAAKPFERAPARMLVGVEGHDLLLHLDGHRDDLVLEAARLDGGEGPVLTLQREDVLTPRG